MLVTKDALNARSIGKGPDVLVFIHGFGSDQSVWASYIPWLSQQHRLILYDLPFSGNADPAFFELRRHGGLDGHVQDLFDILQSFSVKRCTLIGHSLGGLIGLFAAIERPALFEQLILLGTSARYMDGPGYKGGFNQEMLEGMFAAVVENFRGWAEAYAPGATGKPLEDPASQTFLASVLRTRPDIAIAMARPIFLGDYREQVKQCTAPVVLLQTKEDPAVPLEAALALQQCLKHSTLEIIKTTGHLPHLSAPEAVMAALRRHLPRLQDPQKGRSYR
jgi:pimeloyl-ACP methyl ester carboxylesterase